MCVRFITRCEFETVSGGVCSSDLDVSLILRHLASVFLWNAADLCNANRGCIAVQSCEHA